MFLQIENARVGSMLNTLESCNLSQLYIYVNAIFINSMPTTPFAKKDCCVRLAKQKAIQRFHTKCFNTINGHRQNLCTLNKYVVQIKIGIRNGTWY